MKRSQRRAQRFNDAMPSSQAKPLPTPAPQSPPIPRDAPDHACSAIWADGDWLFVQLPTPKGNIQTLSFACNAAGAIALMRFLHTRANAARTAEAQRFATPYIPIQHMIDALQASSVSVQRVESERERARREKKEAFDALNKLVDDLI